MTIDSFLARGSALLYKALLGLILCSLISSHAVAKECPGTPREITGLVYCDNLFTLWINGEEVVTDPVDFTPHQAVRFSFDWDGTTSLTYAIQCEDYASESGYEYIESSNPKLGDGALIAEFQDGLGSVTDVSNWKVYTATFGPTDASLAAGCSASNLEACVVEQLPVSDQWMQPDFDDSEWPLATAFSAQQAGWGRTPKWSAEQGCCTLTSPLDRSTIGCDVDVAEKACLNPRQEFADSPAGFIWAEDLERDNRVLFRYTASCQSDEAG